MHPKITSSPGAFESERRQGRGTWAALASVVANTAAYSDSSVLKDRTYSYRVRAHNGAGASTFLNEVTVKVSCTTKGKSTNCK